ncbi:YjbQ family protein [Catenovulum sp. SM1970]|uniref:secondary thiamine-phosphate synthase enzyme YjbQ n=1 Tax=Marinifaba aquimaris TaxID=2741323 RepID=UPI001574BDBD|nr:secondary thiamine-phosphate synthase enzyme YjbQ [Marinifaba aquimaris]NTS77822.1 YjbQ family protein [Marinifaba aquimaris]
MWQQFEISLSAKQRGFHLVDNEVIKQLPALSQYKIGIAHLLLQHTSASLTLNENADPTVRSDFEAHINKMVPENAPYYQHIYEGPDDMPAHIKSSLLGVSLSIPVANGRFAMGTWQGIYLGEHRDYASSRKIIVTLNGELR